MKTKSMNPLSEILIIDAEKCTGCRICELVCSFYHEREFNPTKSRIHVLKWEREGIDIPSLCLHCETPICEAACPTNAIYKDAKGGAVLINEDLCIGCKACALACPFGAISIDLEKRKIIKCDMCRYDPKCVKFCPTGAIQFVKAHKFTSMKRDVLLKKMAELYKKYCYYTAGGRFECSVGLEK